MTPTFESLPVEVQDTIRYAYAVALACVIEWGDYRDNLSRLRNLLEKIETLWPEFREGKEEVENGKLG